VANLREGVIAVDEQEQLVLMNRAAVDLLSRGERVATGCHLQSVVRNAEIVDVYYQTDQGSLFRKEVELHTNGRRLHLEVYAARIDHPRHGGIAGLLVLHDVTSMVQAAEMKAEFVANASHELRTPLATIRATVESLHAFGPDDREAFEKFLGILDRHIARLEGMTNDLLDLHKVETSGYRIRRESIPLGSLVDWAEEHYAEQAQQRQVTFRASADEPQFVLKCDRALIQLVLQNLIDNGLKFTPPGGQVVLEIAAEPDAVVMTVRDTGCGIPPGEQTQVFERFYQVDPSRTGDSNIRGTGLGLAIVRHAAERLDAQVALTSEPGKGTTFTVRLKA
jgi:two-component system phosphate regulon sensor histidine kinase PhoR